MMACVATTVKPLLLVLTCRYKTRHVELQAPYPYLPLNTYRAVFVSDRLENPHRAGPNNRGAAIIMGNQEKQWLDSYWKNQKIRVVNEATQQLGRYREALLDDSAGQADKQ